MTFCLLNDVKQFINSDDNRLKPFTDVIINAMIVTASDEVFTLLSNTFAVVKLKAWGTLLPFSVPVAIRLLTTYKVLENLDIRLQSPASDTDFSSVWTEKYKKQYNGIVSGIIGVFDITSNKRLNALIEINLNDMVTT